MREFVVNIFESYGIAILYVHVVSAVLFIGTLFSMRFLIYGSIKIVADEEERYRLYLEILRRFFIFSCIALPITVFAAMFMDIGFNFKYGDPMKQAMVSIKGSAWILIVLNLIYMYKRYLNALNAFKNDVLIETSENVAIIIKYLIPLTFVFGLVAILLGSLMRGC